MISQVTTEEGTVVVTFEGIMDICQGRAVRDLLLHCVKGARSLFIDLSGVPLADTSAVANLVEIFHAARKRNVEFALVAVTPAVMQILDVARLGTVFPFHDSLPVAVVA